MTRLQIIQKLMETGEYSVFSIETNPVIMSERLPSSIIHSYSHKIVLMSSKDEKVSFEFNTDDHATNEANLLKRFPIK